jgi:hypothetical protein
MDTLTHLASRYPELSTLAFLTLPIVVLALSSLARAMRVGPVR